MAKPRVFISSTFYDLRQIREEVERFIRDLGYEPVRNETGAIPYGKEVKLEDSAYREVELSDIIVSVIGGRFGTESRERPGYSISQVELQRALERGVQVFVFIEKSVLAEYSTYLLNKDVAGFKPRFVDDVKVYSFVEKLHQLPQNNAIAPFETGRDIVDYLRVQWAGLFHKFLQSQARQAESRVIEELNNTSHTLKGLVDYLTAQRDSKDEVIKGILMNNHPAFTRLAELTGTPYRVYFTNYSEFSEWMKSRGWADETDNPFLSDGSVYEWRQSRKSKDGSHTWIEIKEKIFDDDGRLKVYAPSEWRDDWVIQVVTNPTPKAKEDDDDIPF